MGVRAAPTMNTGEADEDGDILNNLSAIGESAIGESKNQQSTIGNRAGRPNWASTLQEAWLLDCRLPIIDCRLLAAADAFHYSAGHVEHLRRDGEGDGDF